MEEGELPFVSDLVTIAAVTIAVRTRVNSRADISLPAVQNAMKSLGMRKLEGQLRVEGFRPRLWVWRNHEKWLDASSEEVREEYKHALKTEAVTDALA